MVLFTPKGSVDTANFDSNITASLGSESANGSDRPPELKFESRGTASFGSDPVFDLLELRFDFLAPSEVEDRFDLSGTPKGSSSSLGFSVLSLKLFWLEAWESEESRLRLGEGGSWSMLEELFKEAPCKSERTAGPGSAVDGTELCTLVSAGEDSVRDNGLGDDGSGGGCTEGGSEEDKGEVAEDAEEEETDLRGRGRGLCGTGGSTLSLGAGRGGGAGADVLICRCDGRGGGGSSGMSKRSSGEDSF